ncbi:MAG: uroporphyrinogen-III synthase [Gammaproteobacteria bacterium]|nr:uroporphyrinogen-III synthase [Gammaproteobacteria bacterium]
MANSPLAGVSVLVTRPEHQAGPLCELIEAAGGRAVRFPVLEIADPQDLASVQAQIDRLDQFDIAIFISPNAVQRAVNLVRAQREFPASLQIAAVGRASAKALAKMGLETDIFPATRFDSEALLEMPQLQQVVNKRILIFRGEGGREVLAETLKQRGAQVEYAEVYRRVKPGADVSQLMRAWARGDIDLVTVTSNEGLSNLYDMVGQLGRRWLLATPLVVVSERGVQAAQQLGFSRILLADQASDQAVLMAVERWRASAQTPT